MADAVLGAKTGQNTPDGYYNIERMLKRIAAGPGRLLLCGTCMDARGLTEDDMMEGAKRSALSDGGQAMVAGQMMQRQLLGGLDPIVLAPSVGGPIGA